MSTDPARTLGDRYLLEDVIGRGGTADVYRATDQLLSRPVAVKVLRESTEDESDRRRFTQEATTLARLNHPSLVTVLDAGVASGVDDGQPYLVMELVDGPTLAQCCSTDGALDPARVGRIGAQLADALAYAHAQGVVHRDVKLGNVLLTSDGRAKLADFGIARLIGDTVRHTKTGHAIGTPAYLSPEQVMGDEVTPAADVYSLGLVLLEALTGERAFPGSPTESALVRLSRDPHVPSELPATWSRLLGDMTARLPAQRPTAAYVAQELRAQTAPATTAPADGTRLLTHQVAVAAPATAGPATAGPATSFIDRAGDALARQPGELVARARAMAPDQRGAAAAIAAIVLLVVIAAVAGNTGGPPAGETPTNTPPPSTPARSDQPTSPAISPVAPTPTTGKAPKAPKDNKGKSAGKGKDDDD